MEGKNKKKAEQTLAKNFWKACSSGNLTKVQELLKEPSLDINWGDPELGRTSFYRACGHGHFEIAQLLLQDKRLDVNKPNKGGATPFYIACQSGQYEIVKLLMEFEGVDITKIEGIDNCTPFYIACSQGKLGIVKLLMKDPRTDINQVQLFGASPFHIACQNGQIDIVKLLLNDPRTNINEQDVDDISPLMRACYEERIEIVKILLRHPGIKVNPDIGEDGIGMSPFFIACRHGYIEMAKLLLKEKRVELDNLNSRTSPFYIACQEGHLEIIKWMLISEREIDFTRQCQNRKITPKQQAKILSTLGPMNYETNEDAQIRQQTSLEIYNLLADFENNPLRVKNQLKRSFNLRISSDLFVIVILLLDEYLCLKDEANESIQRFFKILLQLPLDLQHIIGLIYAEERKKIIIPKNQIQDSINALILSFEKPCNS